MLKKALLLLILSYMPLLLEAQSFQQTSVLINSTCVDQVTVMRFNDTVSSSDWNKYKSLLFPANYDQDSKILTPEVSNTLIKKYQEKNRRAICFNLSDVENTILCLFDNQETMEAITGSTMLRAWAKIDLKNSTQIFSDTPVDVNDVDVSSVVPKFKYVGADLQAKDLKKTIEKINRSNVPVPDIEANFFKKIIAPEIDKKAGTLSLITAYAQFDDNKETDDIIIHEALHSKYFSETKFKDIVDKFINKGFDDKNSPYNPLLNCIQKYLNDTGLYPLIFTDKYLRNTEIANVLLMVYQKACPAYKINPAATDLYDLVTSQNIKMPALWYEWFKKGQVKGTTDKYFLYREPF